MAVGYIYHDESRPGVESMQLNNPRRLNLRAISLYIQWGSYPY